MCRVGFCCRSSRGIIRGLRRADKPAPDRASAAEIRVTAQLSHDNACDNPELAANYTGSNFEINHRPSIVSRVTRTLDAVSVGGSWPTITVWLTNSSTTAWFASADTEATAGTVATAEICF